MLPPHPRADLIQSCFLWRDLQHVMPVWKQGFFAITTVIPCFLFLKCFPCWRKARTYKLALYNTLPDFTEDKTSFPGILTGHTIEDNNKMTKTSTKLLQYISAIRSQQTAWQKAPVCHSKAPCERFTQHHRMSVQVFTQTKQFHGSNILALECSHISAAIEEHNFCSPHLTRYQRWLEIPHPPHICRTSSTTKSSALLKSLTTTVYIQTVFSTSQESMKNPQSWCSNNCDGFWKGRVQQLRLHSILVTTQGFWLIWTT